MRRYCYLCCLLSHWRKHSITFQETEVIPFIDHNETEGESSQALKPEHSQLLAITEMNGTIALPAEV